MVRDKRMIKLSLNKPLLDLDEKAVEPEQKLSKLLAEALAYANQGPALKYLEWAIKLKRDGVVELDSNDLNEVLKKFVEGCQTLTNLVKGQLLREVNSAALNNEKK